MAIQTHGSKRPDFKALIEAELSITMTSWRDSTDRGSVCEFYIVAPTLTDAQWTSLKTWRDAHHAGLYLEADVV